MEQPPSTPPFHQVAIRPAGQESRSPQYAPQHSPDSSWLQSGHPINATSPSVGSWQGRTHNLFLPMMEESRAEHCWVDHKGLPHRFRSTNSIIYEKVGATSNTLNPEISQGFQALVEALEEIKWALQATQMGTAKSLEAHQNSGDHLVSTINSLGTSVMTLQKVSAEHHAFLSDFTSWLRPFEAKVESIYKASPWISA